MQIVRSIVSHNPTLFSSQVRCICTIKSIIATGSRDKTIKLWNETGDTSYNLQSTLVGHTDYVSALAYSQTTDTLISGSRDTSLILWNTNSATPSHTLTGHKYQVSALATFPNDTIVSASLDASLRVWKGAECTGVLQGHDAAVLCVLALDDGDTILSGSGDCRVKAWSLSSNACTSTTEAHTDSVRAMAPLAGIGLVTGSHDCTLKAWTLAGECISEFVGHSALVYSVSATADGILIASGSEDATAKIWSIDGTCIQTIDHPGCVWAVAFLPNGDLVTGCADGVARVWSAKESRWAAKEVREGYEGSLVARKEAASHAAANAESGGGNGLPAGLTLEDPSALNMPGTRDGQTKIIKEGSSGIAYSWDATNNTWERIGEVVSGPDAGGSGAGGRTWHNGREWDHVFDVDVADGAPPLKLAMDADENPYSVADRFIDTHDLPVGYREQIVAFILQNTAAARQGRGSGNDDTTGRYVDPYTGAPAYVPPPPSTSTQQQQQYAITGGGADPYTGSGGLAAAKKHVPLTSYMVFDSPPPADGLRKKLDEFNHLLLEEHGLKEGDNESTQSCLMDQDRPAVEELLEAVSSPSREGSISPTSHACTIVLPKLLSWPVPQLFPCLDIARMLLLDQNLAAYMTSTSPPSFVQCLPGSILGAILAVGTSVASCTPSEQVALRCACNLFARDSFLTWLRENSAMVIRAYLPKALSPDATRGVRLGFSTLLANTAVLVAKLPGDELDMATSVIDAAAATLATCPVEDEEAMYRMLCALGTLLPEHSHIRAFAREKGFLASIGDIERSNQPGKIREVASEISRLLRL